MIINWVLWMQSDFKLGAEFGSRLKRIRQDRRMTITDLAKASDLTPAAIWQWENRGKLPRPASLKAVAGALGVHHSFFADNRWLADHERFSSHGGDFSLEELLRAVEAKGFSVAIKRRRR